MSGRDAGSVVDCCHIVRRQLRGARGLGVKVSERASNIMSALLADAGDGNLPLTMTRRAAETLGGRARTGNGEGTAGPEILTETAQFRYKELWQVSQDHHLP